MEYVCTYKLLEWNMDSKESIKIGINTNKKIKHIYENTVVVIIYKNYPIEKSPYGDVAYNLKVPESNISSVTFDSDFKYVTISRETGGFFDNSNFNDSKINRGWIMFHYETE